MVSKKVFMRMFFTFELLVFGGIFLFGKHGLQIILRHEKKNTEIKQSIVALKDSIQELKSKRHAWLDKPFYKEKIAREQLHMCKNDEIVYYTS